MTKDEIDDLEKDNKFLRKVIKTFEKTLNKFIHWVCKKFSVSEEDLIKDFGNENNICLDPVKQLEYEEIQQYEDLG